MMPKNVQCHALSRSTTITDEEYRALTDLVRERFGINLGTEKRSMLVGRLQALLNSMGMRTFKEYYEHVRSDPTSRALLELAGRISTNHTYFYREKAHFDFLLDTALPEIAERRKQRLDFDLRIWSAGCSSGEEPYTLVMLMMEHFGAEYSRWDAGILATDISEKVLAFARRGIYPEERLSLLPEHYKKKYFKRLQTGEWEVADHVKREVTFRRFNLMNERFPFKKPFSMIFCRNVMIYFDEATRDALIRKFHEITEPEGYQFIGHSETLGRDRYPYSYIMPAVYRKES